MPAPKSSHLFRCFAPLTLAALAACAAPVYDYDTDFAVVGGAQGVAGSDTGFAGSAAGAFEGAGAPGSNGSSSNAGSSNAGSNNAGSSNAGSSNGGSSNFAGAAGKPSSAGSSSGGAGQAGAAGATGGGKCTAKPWSAATTYLTGDKATKGGKEYTAAFYTMADPETHCCVVGQDWSSSVSCN